MKGAVTFTLGWLISDKDGYLVTAPSGSPENSFIDEKGKEGSIAYGKHHGYVDYSGSVFSFY